MALVRVHEGWAVMLIDGRELSRFTGRNAKREALRFVAVNNRPHRSSWRTPDSDIARDRQMPGL